MTKTSKELNKGKDSVETILFVRNETTTKGQRKVEEEYRKTFKTYKEKEQLFINEFMSDKEKTDEEYMEIFQKHNKRWIAMCNYNYSRGMHVYTLPNKMYLANKYRPKAIEQSKGILARIRKAINKKAEGINIIVQ